MFLADHKEESPWTPATYPTTSVSLKHIHFSANSIKDLPTNLYAVSGWHRSRYMIPSSLSQTKVWSVLYDDHPPPTISIKDWKNPKTYPFNQSTSNSRFHHTHELQFFLKSHKKFKLMRQRNGGRDEKECMHDES